MLCADDVLGGVRIEILQSASIICKPQAALKLSPQGRCALADLFFTERKPTSQAQEEIGQGKYLCNGTDSS